MKYLKKYENKETPDDILQFFDFDTYDTQITKIEKKKEKIDESLKNIKYKFLIDVNHCILELSEYYGFKETNTLRSRYFSDNEKNIIEITNSGESIHFNLFNNDSDLSYVTSWRIDAGNTYRLIEIFERIKKEILEYSAKKFNV